MNEWKELYGPADIRRLEKKTAVWKKLLPAFSVTVLGICVLLCSLTRTVNAERMEMAVISLSAAAGWVVLYLYRFVLKESCHELDHAHMLRETEREIVRGIITVSEERLRIRGSIRFRPITVDLNGESRRARVAESRVKELKKASGEVELALASGFAAAWREKP